jgi:hypothetical protein
MRPFKGSLRVDDLLYPEIKLVWHIMSKDLRIRVMLCLQTHVTRGLQAGVAWAWWRVARCLFPRLQANAGRQGLSARRTTIPFKPFRGFLSIVYHG